MTRMLALEHNLKRLFKHYFIPRSWQISVVSTFFSFFGFVVVVFVFLKFFWPKDLQDTMTSSFDVLN